MAKDEVNSMFRAVKKTFTSMIGTSSSAQEKELKLSKETELLIEHVLQFVSRKEVKRSSTRKDSEETKRSSNSDQPQLLLSKQTVRKRLCEFLATTKFLIAPTDTFSLLDVSDEEFSYTLATIDSY